MPQYHSRVVTPPNYPVSDSYPPLPHPYGYAAATSQYQYVVPGAVYQQPLYYMPEVEYGSTYTKPRSNVYGGVNSSSFYLPMPIDQGDYRKQQQPQQLRQQEPLQTQRQYPPQVPQEPEVMGGVSATLDYEIDQMAEFVSRMALSIMKIEHPEFAAAFCKFTSQVLTATRMPKSTILLSLVCLAKRWALGRIIHTDSVIHPAYKILVVALLLANKFNDDNTFTNSSWNEATGVPVRDLSMIEMDWLRMTQWSLHLNAKDRKNYNKWNDNWEFWVKRSRPSRTGYPVTTPTAAPLVSSNRYQLPTSSWHDTAESKPPSATSSFTSTGSVESLSMPVSNERPYAPYPQQTYASNYGSDTSNHQCGSFYIGAHGSAGCYCNVCAFPVPHWNNPTPALGAR